MKNVLSMRLLQFLAALCLLSVIPAKAAQFGDFTYTATATEVTIDRYTGTGGAITIPSSIGGLPVTRIEISAFSQRYGWNESITNVTIPNSVTSIGDEAFHSLRGLTSVTIGNSVTDIEDEAFYGCTGLTNVTIPNSVTSIGDEAFFNCAGLTSATIPNSVTSIGSRAFYRCTGLNQIQFEGNAPVISSGAFSSLSAKAKIFVHAGTTGFAARYNGVPVVVLPVAPPVIKSFLLVYSQFVIQVEGSTAGILLEQSTDLQVWSQVTNAVTTGDSFAIPTNGASKAFYRLARQ